MEVAAQYSQIWRADRVADGLSHGAGGAGLPSVAHSTLFHRFQLLPKPMLCRADPLRATQWRWSGVRALAAPAFVDTTSIRGGWDGAHPTWHRAQDAPYGWYQARPSPLRHEPRASFRRRGYQASRQNPDHDEAKSLGLQKRWVEERSSRTDRVKECGLGSAEKRFLLVDRLNSILACRI